VRSTLTEPLLHCVAQLHIHKRSYSRVMSRQEAFSQHRLMSNIDTDLDALSLDSPPSPPLQTRMDQTPSDEDHERDNSDHRHDDNPPETPYYDYACNSPIWTLVDGR
jgi:hypothetical protein